MMSKFRIKTKREFIEALDNAIELLFKMMPIEDDDDKIFFSLLREIKDKLYDKQKNVRNEYSISLTPAQAIALRVMQENYYQNKTTYLGNELHKISREVNQQYMGTF
jgi:hypothetical protein